MAIVTRTGDLELSDYFNKSGFSDGDDLVAKDAGVDWRSHAVELLNEIMKAKGLKWKAEEQDINSIHNTIYIKIMDEERVDLLIESSYSGVEEPSEVASGRLGEDDQNWIVFKKKVWPHVFREFERTVTEIEAKRV